jgi:hypothetical protein
LCAIWGHVIFDVRAVLADLEADRLALVAFERREPAAVRQLVDVQAMVREDFDLVERLARELDVPNLTHWQRPYPGGRFPGSTYGGVGPTSHRRRSRGTWDAD